VAYFLLDEIKIIDLVTLKVSTATETV